MKHGFFGAAAGVVGFALLFTPPLSAQQLATLSVTVRDPSGRVISQARISLHNVDTGAKRTDWSSGTGVAVIPGLPAGSYQLTVESDQFRSYQAPLTGKSVQLGRRGQGHRFHGPISQRVGDGVTSGANPTFGTPNFVAPARQIQIAMRLNF